ncbi:MAG: hypothetical protein WBG92_22965 [Thiohalocapsa sp.]
MSLEHALCIADYHCVALSDVTCALRTVHLLPSDNDIEPTNEDMRGVTVVIAEALERRVEGLRRRCRSDVRRHAGIGGLDQPVPRPAQETCGPRKRHSFVIPE